jgi:hypothetical protein
MPQRFRADHSILDDFADEVLVVCPACGRQAVVRLRALEETAQAGPARADFEARLTCIHCGRNDRETAFVRSINGAADPVFGHPVWLSTPCCGQTLWAYSARHLDALEAFVSAKLRERRADPVSGWRNQSWVSRMPRWLSASTNREEVLRCIGRLRRDLHDSGRSRRSLRSD